MAFMLKDSPECVKSELELFSLPATQTVIESGQWIEYHPLSNVFDGGPVEFNISGSQEYYDLSQTQLYVRAKIVKEDGTNLEAASDIAPVNLFLHSLFSQVDVTLNDRLISNSSNTYPYRAYIETLLNHGQDSKSSQLTSELFYKEKEKRENFFKLSASVDMIGGIHSDIFQSDRLMLNLVDLKIKLTRSKPQFCLIGTTAAKILLEKVSLFIRKVRVSPGVLLGHAKALEKQTAKYPLNRLQCKVYSIPSGCMSFVQDNVFTGQAPKSIIVGCVDSDAFHGILAKSPFDFKHFDLNFIALYIDGAPAPHGALQPDFSKKNYIRAYQSLFQGTGRFGQDKGIFLSREEYANNNTLYAFNLTPDLCDSGHLNLVKHSNLRLELKFAKALSHPISIIVLAEFENIIEINKTRDIIFDFSA